MRKVAGSDLEKYYIASHWQLMGRKFLQHKLALAGLIILVVLYTLAIFCQFFAPYDPYRRFPSDVERPPSRIHIANESAFGLRPFVYGVTRGSDPISWRRTYVEDRSERYYLRFFTQGEEYKLFGLFRTQLHFFGVEPGADVFLFGTDILGRDLFSRNLYAARVSLSIGLVGVALSFVIGVTLGGISGYFGGRADMVIQRIIDFLISIPAIPIWMGLSAAVPKDWSPLKVYFAITLILSIVGWCGLARVVRGKLLSSREEEFVLAAKIAGARDGRIIVRHLIPSFLSFLIVNITLAIPNMILGETALSFLGLGIRPPAVSWGTLLKGAQNVRTLAMQPWLLIPGLFVIVTVIAFNFVGDGLRDAADPYK